MCVCVCVCVYGCMVYGGGGRGNCMIGAAFNIMGGGGGGGGGGKAVAPPLILDPPLSPQFFCV